MYKIEKNVAVPHTRNDDKYPFDQMQVGDSFFVPCSGANTREARHVRNHVAGRNHEGKAAFITRTVDGGVRVWRAK